MKQAVITKSTLHERGKPRAYREYINAKALEVWKQCMIYGTAFCLIDIPEEDSEENTDE